MKLSKQIKLVIAFVISGFLFILFAPPLTREVAYFLSNTEKVDADILVVEGWLGYDDLKTAIDEFNSGEYKLIITTGIKSTTDYFNINTDGFLIFNTARYNSVPVKKIGIKAKSELGGENCAHFNLWINDSIVAGFVAGKKKHIYSVDWNGPSPDSVMIQFDNDLMGIFGDRNLYVSEIILNDKTTIPFLNNSIYDIGKLDNRHRIVNNMRSNSELTAKRLVSLGVDSSKIMAIPGNRVRINRTLNSALALRNWIEKTGLKVRGINIISSGTHSRRTGMTFRKVLHLNTGIIALNDRKHTGADGIGYLKTLRESIAFIYYSIILIPY